MAVNLCRNHVGEPTQESNVFEVFGPVKYNEGEKNAIKKLMHKKQNAQPQKANKIQEKDGSIWIFVSKSNHTARFMLAPRDSATFII